MKMRKEKLKIPVLLFLQIALIMGVLAGTSRSVKAEGIVNSRQLRGIAGEEIKVTPDNLTDYFVLNGSTTFNPSDGIITLTEDATWKVGNVTLKTKIDMTESFSLKGKINLGNKKASEGGADGIAFFLHPHGIDVVGDAGNSMGIGSIPWALGFKVDTYYNPGSGYWSKEDPARYTEDNSFGAFVYTDGGMITTSYENLGNPLADVKLVSNPSANTFNEIEIDYDGAGIMTVKYEGLTWEIDAVSELGLDLSKEYAFGWVGSTGNYYNKQQLLIDEFIFYPKYVEGTVVVSYVDDEGSPLRQNQVLTGAAGTSYTTNQETFQNYTFKEVQGNATGSFDASKVIEVTYVYEANKYDVTYQFESGTSGKILPQGVEDLLPGKSMGHKTGASVTLPTITPTQIAETDGSGTWDFTGWTPSSVSIGTVDVTVVGTWTFTAAPTYNISYSYASGTLGKTIPTAVNATYPVPPTVTGKYAGNTVTIPTSPTVGDTVSVLEGTWTFVGWDKTAITIANADEEFVGTWKFEAKEQELAPTAPKKPTAVKTGDTNSTITILVVMLLAATAVVIFKKKRIV